VRRATKAAVIAFGLFFASLGIVMGAGIAAVWLTDEARVFGLVVLPATIVATLLVLYFDWRAKLFERVAGDAPASLAARIRQQPPVQESEGYGRSN
jgi:hypothetical protein